VREATTTGGEVTVSAPASTGAAAVLAAAGEAVGAFPLSPGSRDAALIAHLPAGGYTATVTGGGSVGSGVVLVEVYELP